MTDRTSRRPGWGRLTPAQRLAEVAEWLGETPESLRAALDDGGLAPADADRRSEGVLGTFALPFAVAPNFRIDGREVLVPMVVEEPSVVAAASNGARLVREGGGFHTRCDPPHVAAQVQLAAPEPDRARDAILAARAEVLARAAAAVPGLVSRGGGPVDLEARVILDESRRPAFLVVHLVLDVRDAMGANLVDQAAEAVAPLLAGLAGGPAGLRIVTNLADRRKVRVEAHVPGPVLACGGRDGAAVREGIVQASRFAELDPWRAATHNKGVLNGTDAVVVATGNDWRAVEAGAHAWAARQGRYGPLATWRADGDGVTGVLEMPMSVGIVGAGTRLHRAAALALRILDARSWTDVAAAAGAAGLASNLAALRVLATEGIQRGHMRLADRARAPGKGTTE